MSLPVFAQTLDSQDWYKHTVSDSVFKVTQIIELVDDGRAFKTEKEMTME